MSQTSVPAAKSVNGTANDNPFPVDSYREAAPHLRRPFTQHAVKFKVQATWPKDAPTGGLIVAYIDARLVIERLNLVVPHLWHDAYRSIGDGQMWCDLTIDAITRSDVGEGTGKGLVSDALKRAAVRFGIGVSLYAIPKMILDVRDDALKRRRDKLELTAKGESVLRLMYAAWLDDNGTRAFGEPLDHGDAADAQGDHEADPPPNVNAQTGEVAPGLPFDDVCRMAALARQLIDADVLTPAQVKTNLVAAGATDTGSVKAALATLTPENAAELEQAFTDLLPTS